MTLIRPDSLSAADRAATGSSGNPSEMTNVLDGRSSEMAVRASASAVPPDGFGKSSGLAISDGVDEKVITRIPGCQDWVRASRRCSHLVRPPAGSFIDPETSQRMMTGPVVFTRLANRAVSPVSRGISCCTLEIRDCNGFVKLLIRSNVEFFPDVVHHLVADLVELFFG